MTDKPKQTPEGAADSPEQKVTPKQPLPIDETRAGVADVLRSQTATAELSPDERIRFIALGDQLLQGKITTTDATDNYYPAMRAYAKAGASDKLIALGDRCVTEGQLGTAYDVYAEADATDKLIELADLCCEDGRLQLAAAAYAKAGDTHNRLAIAGDFLRGIPTETIIAYLKTRFRS